MHYFIDYIIFLAKTVTIVVALLIVITTILSNVGKGKEKGRLRIKNINDKYLNMAKELNKAMMKKHELKKFLKSEKKSDKAGKKKDKKSAKQRKRLFVLEFNGDIKASPVKSLREEISAILGVATKKDEVLLKLESPGGMVHAYGLAASQLQRLPAHKIPLTVAVDKVAASGGYMMACVANNILAAPLCYCGLHWCDCPIA